MDPNGPYQPINWLMSDLQCFCGEVETCAASGESTVVPNSEDGKRETNSDGKRWKERGEGI